MGKGKFIITVLTNAAKLVGCHKNVDHKTFYITTVEFFFSYIFFEHFLLVI